jgi:hypothetical protein
VQQGALNAAPNTFNLGLIQPGLQGQLGNIQDQRQQQLLALQQQQELQPFNFASNILNQSAGVGSAFGQQSGNFQNQGTATQTPGLLDFINAGANVAGAISGFGGGGGAAPQQAQAPQVQQQQFVSPQFTPSALQLSGPF